MKTKKWKVFMSYSFEMNSKRKWGPIKAEIKKQIKTDTENNTINGKNFTLEECGEAAGYG